MTQTEALSIVDTMKLALEALESITWVNSFHEGDYLTCNFKNVETSITAIKESLQSNEQLEPEHSATHGGPVAVVDLRNVNYVRWLDGAVFIEGTKLYTHPPQRKPLTDEQIYSITGVENRDEMMHRMARNIARAIEAAHGIKE